MVKFGLGKEGAVNPSVPPAPIKNRTSILNFKDETEVVSNNSRCVVIKNPPVIARGAKSRIALNENLSVSFRNEVVSIFEVSQDSFFSKRVLYAAVKATLMSIKALRKNELF